jgi:hypothetical protein
LILNVDFEGRSANTPSSPFARADTGEFGGASASPGFKPPASPIVSPHIVKNDEQLNTIEEMDTERKHQSTGKKSALTSKQRQMNNFT